MSHFEVGLWLPGVGIIYDDVSLVVVIFLTIVTHLFAIRNSKDPTPCVAVTAHNQKAVSTSFQLMDTFKGYENLAALHWLIMIVQFSDAAPALVQRAAGGPGWW